MGSKLLVLLILTSTCNLSTQGVSREFAGPYDFNFKYIEKCEDEGTGEIEISSFKTNKINRKTFVYSGAVTLYNRTLNDDNVIESVVAYWGNGGWIDNYFVKSFTKPFSMWKTISPKYYDHVFEKFGFGEIPIKPVRKSELVTKGVYKAQDVYITPDFQMEFLPYNKYKGKFSVFDKDVKCGCIGIEWEIVPISTQRNKKG